MTPTPESITESNRRTIVVAVDDQQVLRANLLSSPDLCEDAVPVLIEDGHSSAGSAYNAGMSRATSDLVIFAHQDVYFPAGWFTKLDSAIGHLDRAAEPWGVLGVWGVRADGHFAGQCWCSGGNTEHAAPVDGPVQVASIDEIVIVLNRRAGLRFDDALPGFHLYATDIILQARERGYGAYVFHAPVVHNSRCNPQPLGTDYCQAYRYMQRKWRGQLPVRTCVVDVTRFGLPLWKKWTLNTMRRLRRRVTYRNRPDHPEAIAVRLGYQMNATSSAL